MKTREEIQDEIIDINRYLAANDSYSPRDTDRAKARRQALEWALTDAPKPDPIPPRIQAELDLLQRQLSESVFPANVNISINDRITQLDAKLDTQTNRFYSRIAELNGLLQTANREIRDLRRRVTQLDGRD